MKILIITNSLEGNDGWSRYTFDLVNQLRRKNDQNLYIKSIVNKSVNENICDEISILDEPIEYICNPLKSFLLFLKIKKIIKSYQPDIIHITVEPYLTFLPYLHKGKAKIISTIHGSFSYFPELVSSKFKKLVSHFFLRLSYRKVDSIIAVSEYTKNYLIKKLRIPKNKIKVISNGIDTEIFNRKKEIIHNQTKNILFVGAVKSRKGILESIEALGFYKELYSDDFLFNIVGFFKEEDQYVKDIRRKIKNHNLEKNIKLTGRVTQNELMEYYTHADLFLLMPVNRGITFEGFGLVYLEANAFGVPCIGVRDCGAEEAIIDGVTGYLVDGEDGEDVAIKVNDILNRKSINSEDCIKWAATNDIKLKVKEILDLYYELIHLK